MRFFTVRLMSDQRGATAIEYGLIVAVIVIALIAGFQNLASVTTGMWNNVNSAVTNAH
ncbi:MAG: Flp family type IVb pilin [Sphingomonadales bacterium]|nr:Flp family type IVb pilin [Sphingomonadales bacterium]